MATAPTTRRRPGREAKLHQRFEGTVNAGRTRVANGETVIHRAHPVSEELVHLLDSPGVGGLYDREPPAADGNLRAVARPAADRSRKRGVDGMMMMDHFGVAV